MKKYWLLQVLHVFRSVLCADYDPSTHSDEDQTHKTIIQGFGHSWMYATSVTAVERGHHWSMLMDMNIDSRLGWQRFRIQYCEIGRYDKKKTLSFIIHMLISYFNIFMFGRFFNMYKFYTAYVI